MVDTTKDTWNQAEADRLAAVAVAAFAALRWPRDPARRRQIAELADAVDAAFLRRDLGGLRLAVACFLPVVQQAEQEASQQAAREAAEDSNPGQAAPPPEILRAYERERARPQARQATRQTPPPNGVNVPATADPSEIFAAATLFS